MQRVLSPPIAVFYEFLASAGNHFLGGRLSLSIIFFLSVLLLIYTVCRLHADGTMSASGSKDTLLIYYVHRSYIHQCPVFRFRVVMCHLGNVVAMKKGNSYY